MVDIELGIYWNIRDPLSKAFTEFGKNGENNIKVTAEKWNKIIKQIKPGDLIDLLGTDEEGGPEYRVCEKIKGKTIKDFMKSLHKGIKRKLTNSDRFGAYKYISGIIGAKYRVQYITQFESGKLSAYSFIADRLFTGSLKRLDNGIWIFYSDS